ncbi:hypothetical protein DFP96_11838 [Listeria rocourtiae]|uniref:Uncharacterized protein n=1 Tax=Listeria rocourtiae TaxID=647910 RepID=A0A4R6ZFM9_9LIST|nr:hypothetical protein PROCOU_05253 [Listeria rocourtiae FSL F6-920]TDR50714.1 hypothetical protein DFP96_11838 [Listeria rocourtiae]
MQTIIAFDVNMGKSYMVIYQHGQCIEEKEIQHNREDFQALQVTIQSFLCGMVSVQKSCLKPQASIPKFWNLLCKLMSILITY